MAQQTGILRLRGTVGGLVFRKDASVAQKPASNKAAFANKASMERTRENDNEFGLAAKYSKLLRDTLRVAISAANSAPLLGFNFNGAAGIGQTMYFPFEVTDNGADVTLSIPALNPVSDIAAPQGASHFERVFAAAELDMETLTFRGAPVAVALRVLPINNAPLANQQVVATFPAAPAVASLVVGVVGINFYQQVNGKFYPLNNNSTNSLAIEYVA